MKVEHYQKDWEEPWMMTLSAVIWGSEVLPVSGDAPHPDLPHPALSSLLLSPSLLRNGEADSLCFTEVVPRPIMVHYGIRKTHGA